MIPWKICINGDKTLLKAFLVCTDKNGPFEHRFKCSAKLISTVSKEYDFKRCLSPHIFTSKGDKDRLWGWMYFITLTELKHERKGFVSNGKFKIQVNVECCE